MVLNEEQLICKNIENQLQDHFYNIIKQIYEQLTNSLKIPVGSLQTNRSSFQKKQAETEISRLSPPTRLKLYQQHVHIC